MSAPQAINILNSRICRCGQPKLRRVPFCGHCYDSLPQEVREATWYRIGRGFEVGYKIASDWLKQHAS